MNVVLTFFHIEKNAMSIRHTIKQIIAGHISLPTPYDGAAADKAAREIELFMEQFYQQTADRIKELEHQNHLLRQILANSVSDNDSQKLAS